MARPKRKERKKKKKDLLPAIPLLDIYSKELKAATQTDIYTPLFMVALFTIAKRWKQPKCPSMNEWIYKMWYIPYNGILFSLRKE